MKSHESRREFMKKGVVTTAGLLGLSNIDISKAAVNKPQAKKKIIVEKTKKIFTSVGKKSYNAWTNMAFWRGKYYVFFTQKYRHHPDPEGVSRIVVLESPDLESWSASMTPNVPGDDRDAKVLVTPDRMILYNTPWPWETLVTYTEDGKNWSEAVPAYPGGGGAGVTGGHGPQFWKPKEHNGLYYVACDYTNDKVDLLKSTDGIKFEFVSKILSDEKHPHTGNPTETAIVFLADGRCLAMHRLNGYKTPVRPHSAIAGFSIASPPYTSWEFTLGNAVLFSGHAVERFGDTIFVAARGELGKHPGYWDVPNENPEIRTGERTCLYTVNLETMRLEFHAFMPPEHGHDTSYCGILATGKDTALVTYYCGDVKAKSDIWLANIRLV